MRNYLESRRRQVVDKVVQCNAWLAFMRHPGWERLFEMGVEINENWYNDWADFDCRFPDLNDQKPLRAAINSMFLTETITGDPTLFKRRDIYDKMAYASFPLDWFVVTEAKCKVTFSLPLPMVFAVSSFELKRQRPANYNDQWWGRLYLRDGRVPNGRYSKREVAERRNFPNEMTRSEMFEVLLNKVREKEEASLFTITGDSMIGAMIQAESEQLLALKPE
jgi:hypothetical protein